MNKRILFITTVYRTGEKVYPIIPDLSRKHTINVLNLYQMSNKTRWKGNVDLRQQFYVMCESLGLRSFHGPPFHLDKDIKARAYTKYFSKLDKICGTKYDLAIIDNNTTVKGGQLSHLYQWLKKQGATVVACPHGNKEFKKYRIADRIGRLYDYSFIFGRKEQKQLLKTNRKYKKVKSRLLCGGIPSNDALKDYVQHKKYILIIPNFTEEKHIIGQAKGHKAFTKKTFEELNILKLSNKYNCPILIKEKNKNLIYKTTELKKSLRQYKEVQFVLDVKDDNELIANARCVISAPSTMAFKSIQIGIPTAILQGHGMVGNFYDFPGLIKPEWKYLKKTLKQQQNGRNEKFLENTLERSVDFNSTNQYLDNIEQLLEK